MLKTFWEELIQLYNTVLLSSSPSPVGKGAIKDVQGGVIHRAMLRVVEVAPDVLEPEPHSVPIIVAADLHPQKRFAMLVSEGVEVTEQGSWGPACASEGGGEETHSKGGTKHSTRRSTCIETQDRIYQPIPPWV